MNKLDDAITLYCVYIDRCEIYRIKSVVVWCTTIVKLETVALYRMQIHKWHRFPSPHKEMCFTVKEWRRFLFLVRRGPRSSCLFPPPGEGTSGPSVAPGRSQWNVYYTVIRIYDVYYFLQTPHHSHQFASLKKVVATAAAATGRSSSPRPQMLYMCRKMCKYVLFIPCVLYIDICFYIRYLYFIYPFA